MMITRFVLLSIFLSLAPGCKFVLAQPAPPDSIRILAGGENYNGPPVMAVLADGKVIDKVSVNNAVKGVPAANLTDKFIAENLTAYDVTIPSLRNVQVLRIEFVNDEWSGSIAGGDRNLWIGRVTVGGTTVTPDKFEIPEKGVGRNNSVAVVSGNVGIEINRPEAGWVLPTVVAKERACVGRTSLTMIDYVVNQTQPSEADSALLTRSLAKIRGLSRCKLTVAVSNSPVGAADINARIAQLRAEAVISLVVKAGASRNRITVAPPKNGKMSVTVAVAP